METVTVDFMVDTAQTFATFTVCYMLALAVAFAALLKCAWER